MPTPKQKLAEASEKMAQSRAFHEICLLNPGQWAELLTLLGEEAVEDGLLLLKEEADGHMEIEKKRSKRHQVNRTRLLQHLEKHKIELKQLLTKKNG